MKDKTFAVMGATGHIGHVICEDLLKRGHLVRAIGRDVEKLRKLDQKGASLIFTEVDDLDMLTKAFKDCYAVFCLLPPAIHENDYRVYQNCISETIARALSNAEVERVVNLSSLGAHLSEGTGPISGLYAHEQRLNQLKDLKTLIHLRPSFFMENPNQYLPMIFSQNQIASPFYPTLAIPMVATRDIGWKAADFLDSTAEFPHLEFEFVGPQEVTMQDVVAGFSECLKIAEISYRQISYDEARNWAIQQGMSGSIADMYVEMYRAFNNELIVPTRDLHLTHHGVTTLSAYLQHLVHKHLAPLST
jgi:uncharacterized protein YbjT (DUF2867 family)